MWTPYVIRPGDYVTQLAHAAGVPADDVWSHALNAALRGLREDMDVLSPGDVVFLPRGAHAGMPIAPGACERFVAGVPFVMLNVVLQVGGRPIALEPFVVQGLAVPLPGLTDGDGRLSVPVPVYAREVQVFLPLRNEVFPFVIGGIDPVDTRAGARGRLGNLGYYGYYRAQLDPSDEAFARAVGAFQHDQKLPVTYALDADTAARLVAVHGS